LEKEKKMTASCIVLMSSDKDTQAIWKVFAVWLKVKDLKHDDKVIYQSYSKSKNDYIKKFKYVIDNI
jgi:chaperonin GroES